MLHNHSSIGYTTISLHTVIILGSHNPFASLSSETLNVSRFASKLTNLLVNFIKVDITLGFPAGTSGKEPTCQCRRHKRHRFDPWIGKIPWRRAWQPTPVFWPGESHGQRSLAEYSPWGCQELNTTEQLTLSLHVLAIVNSAAMNTRVHMFFFNYGFLCIYAQ